MTIDERITKGQDDSRKLVKFLDTAITEDLYGFYSYLFCQFLTSFRSVSEWEDKILPYLELLIEGKGIITDWNSFPWGGTICFRLTHVLIIEENEKQTIFPGLRDENENPILNENHNWLYDTEGFEKMYKEFVKIPIVEFYEICVKWNEFLKEQYSKQ